MALDPGIPNDLKKKVPDATGSQAVRAAVTRNTQNTLPNAMYPQPSVFDNVRGGPVPRPSTGVNPGVSFNNYAADVGDAARQAYGKADNALRGVFGAAPADYSGTPVRDAAVNAGFATPAPINRGVRAGVVTTASPGAVTPDAVNAGPPRPEVNYVDSPKVQTRMPSALDVSAPLPAGVRQYVSDGYHGTPGSNDVIYEGRGAHGERSFSNNQFARTLTGRGADPTLDVNAALRSKEIGRSVDAQTAAANAAANAAALAPRSVDDLAKLAKIKSDALAAGDAHAGAQADIAGKVGSNINNDVYTKAANESATALIGRGVDPGEAQRRGSIDAAARALAAGEDPSNPRLAPAARGGYTEGLRELANIVNTAPPRVNTSGGDMGIIPALFPAFDKSGTVVNPDKTDAGDYSIDQTLGQKFLSGPPDEHGVRRHVQLNDDQADRLSPLINFRKSKRKPLISDSK